MPNHSKWRIAPSQLRNSILGGLVTEALTCGEGEFSSMSPRQASLQWWIPAGASLSTNGRLKESRHFSLWRWTRLTIVSSLAPETLPGYWFSIQKQADWWPAWTLSKKRMTSITTLCTNAYTCRDGKASSEFSNSMTPIIIRSWRRFPASREPAPLSSCRNSQQVAVDSRERPERGAR